LGFGHTRSRHVCKCASIKNEGGGVDTNKATHFGMAYRAQLGTIGLRIDTQKLSYKLQKDMMSTKHKAYLLVHAMHLKPTYRHCMTNTNIAQTIYGT
jgi:ribosomal protein L21E